MKVSMVGPVQLKLLPPSTAAPLQLLEPSSGDGAKLSVLAVFVGYALRK